jgi:hypothetical protein
LHHPPQRIALRFRRHFVADIPAHLRIASFRMGLYTIAGIAFKNKNSFKNSLGGRGEGPVM